MKSVLLAATFGITRGIAILLALPAEEKDRVIRIQPPQTIGALRGGACDSRDAVSRAFFDTEVLPADIRRPAIARCNVPLFLNDVIPNRLVPVYS
jgi:hypothetical protein